MARFFTWDPIKDEFEFIGENNTYLLEQKIGPMRGIPPQRKREVYALVRKRARILQKLNESGITDYYEFFKVIAKAQKEGVF